MNSSRDEQFVPLKLNRLTVGGIALVSLVYFADIVLRASQKCFWFDELFTVYLCRLPSFTSTWSAAVHGADFNPPLFYLLTRGVERLFGEGLIATRLPEMVGVWLFCLCLFFFVGRRAGAIPGFIAGVFPFFTLVKYYASEARAHGISLGWCGLMLLCWQRIGEGRAKCLWLAGFGLSFLCALLTHVYAIYLLLPFVVVEMCNLVKRGRPNWGIIAVMALALTSVTVTAYLPLFRAYNTMIPANFLGANWNSLARSRINVIGPATILLFVFVLVSAARAGRRKKPSHAAAAMPQREMVLAAGLASIPLAALIGCLVTNGPFFDRYFLSSVAGYAIVIGYVCSSRYGNSGVARAMAGCMFLLMVADLGGTLYLVATSRLVLFEPSSGFHLDTIPANPMHMYQTLAVDHGELDVLVLQSTDYLFLVRYASPSVVSHLYYGAPANDINRAGIERLAKETGMDLKTTSADPFLATRKHFLVYEGLSTIGNSTRVDALQAIARGGSRLKSVRVDLEGFLYEYGE